jgi:cell division protein FtsW
VSFTTLRVRTRDPRAGRRHGDSSVTASLKALLDRPNAPYVIILGSVALLVILGVIMVLSASSVESLRQYGSSFYFWRKQVRFYALGVLLLVVCARLPVRIWRALAYPSLIISGALLAVVPVIGTSVNGNRNWITLAGI